MRARCRTCACCSRKAERKAEERDLLTSPLFTFNPSDQAQEGLSGAQPGWLMMCKELFRLGLTDEAMSLVKRGYDDGWGRRAP